MQKVLIHPGMNKTATHFLRNVILPEIKDIDKLIDDDGLRSCYLYPTEELWGTFFAGIDAAKPLLIHDGSITAHDPLIGISNIAKKFPDASIMVTVRSPWDLLISNYLHKVDKGLYFFPFRTFLMAERSGQVLKITSAANIVSMLMDKFDGRVKVFFYEEYKHSMEPIVQHILETLGSDEKYSEMVFKESVEFRNESIVGLSVIMRLYNLAYFALNFRLLPPKVRNAIEQRKNWIRQQVRGSRRLAARKERKLVEYRKLISSMYGESFEYSHLELEKILGRKLPPEYFPSKNA